MNSSFRLLHLFKAHLKSEYCEKFLQHDDAVCQIMDNDSSDEDHHYTSPPRDTSLCLDA